MTATGLRQALGQDDSARGERGRHVRDGPKNTGATENDENNDDGRSFDEYGYTWRGRHAVECL